MNEVIKRSKVDVSIIDGHRGKERQNEAFKNGFSTLKYPDSKHNSNPSRAVDVAPYPIDWKDIERFEELALIIFEVANEMNVDIEWGGNWKNFPDVPHWQLA
jgi:peptidoglycan L-alanyl-D-glutamate endopeptidase CwlK